MTLVIIKHSNIFITVLFILQEFRSRILEQCINIRLAAVIGIILLIFFCATKGISKNTFYFRVSKTLNLKFQSVFLKK